MCFIYKGVSFGGSKNPMRPQCTGVKEKIIRLVWLRDPKVSSGQSTQKMTGTTTGYSRCWGLLENGALQTPINTQMHPRVSFAFHPSLWKATRRTKETEQHFGKQPPTYGTCSATWQLLRKKKKGIWFVSAKSWQKLPPNISWLVWALIINNHIQSGRQGGLRSVAHSHFHSCDHGGSAAGYAVYSHSSC